MPSLIAHFSSTPYFLRPGDVCGKGYQIDLGFSNTTDARVLLLVPLLSLLQMVAVTGHVVSAPSTTTEIKLGDKEQGQTKEMYMFNWYNFLLICIFSFDYICLMPCTCINNSNFLINFYFILKITVTKKNIFNTLRGPNPGRRERSSFEAVAMFASDCKIQCYQKNIKMIVLKTLSLY